MPVDPHAGVPTPNTLADASKMRAQLDALFTPVNPSCRVRRTTNQSIPHSTDTAIQFDDEAGTGCGDNATMHDPASNTRITVPLAGWYAIGGSCRWDNTGDLTGTRYLSIRLGGSTVLDQSAKEVSGDALMTQSVHMVVKLAATNYVELVVTQTRGGAAALDTVAVSPHVPIFWATYVSAP